MGWGDRIPINFAIFLKNAFTLDLRVGGGVIFSTSTSTFVRCGSSMLEIEVHLPTSV